MRKYAKPIILVLIAAILGGVYIFAINKKDSSVTPTVTPADTLQIYNLDLSKVTEVTIEKEDGKFVFQKSGDSYKMTSPTDFVADSEKIKTIFNNVVSIFAEKVIEENVADLSKYGLDKPSKVTVKYDAGVKELEIGNINATKDSYYVKEKGSNKVYTIGAYTVQAILIPKNDLRDKSLFAATADNIKYISFMKDGQLVFTSKKSDEGIWSITAPIQGNANSLSMTGITTAISQVGSYVSFIEDKPADLNKYGLANPRYSLEVETAAGKKTLLLGSDLKKDQETYAKMADSTQVFTINPETLNFLDKPLRDIIEVFVYIPNIKDVSQVVVDMDGKTTTSIIEVSEDGKSDKFTVDGKDANITDDKNNNLFKKYYQGLIGVTFSEIDTNAKPSGKAEITFTYTLKKDPKTMKVEFIPKDATSYYVVKNGVYANFIVDKKEFDKDDGVRQTYKTLMDAINK